MVGFGRTEKSLSLSCTEIRALSHGHGFRDPCFNGVRKSWGYHDFKKTSTIPKDAARSGDLGKRVDEAKTHGYPKSWLSKKLGNVGKSMEK